MNKKVLFFLIFILCFLPVTVLGFPEQDYFGFLNYVPHFNVTYLFYIDSNQHTISFHGINDTNSNHYVSFLFDQNNSFLQRLNYVWFYGIFNESALEVTSYVPAEIFYSENYLEISPGVYSAYFSLNNSFFDFGKSSFNVTLDTNSNMSIIDSFDDSLEDSKSNLLYAPNFSMAAHIQDQGLIETKLVNNKTSLEVHLWVKENLFRDGLGPQWINPLFAVNNFSLNLISPQNGQIFDVSSNFAEINFNFEVNSSYNESSQICNVNIFGNNSTVVLNTSLITFVNYSLPLGDYQWFVSCNIFGSTLFSNNSSFIIRPIVVENPVLKLKVDSDEGGRKRIRLSTQNLSLNSSISEPIEKSNNSVISLITGAVIGTLGNKGALGLGILLIVLGFVALIIYNRDKLGLLKKVK